MPLVYACITPHGSDIIPELAATPQVAESFRKTRSAMQTISKAIRLSRPDTVVIATPHNLRLWKKIGICFAENSFGELRSDNGDKKTISLRARCDVKFARMLYQRSVLVGLPVVGANYGTSEGPYSSMPMDWGTMVPLWFLAKSHGSSRELKPQVVITTPSREIPMSQLIKFGNEIQKLSRISEKRIVFVASADQAHAHSKQGPYGLHRAAVEFDQIAVKSIQSGDLKPLFKLDPRFIEDAKPDSLWQLAILEGVLSKMKITPRLLSYEVPTYFGMICGDFSPLQKSS
ncbi:MAG: DODA-type extradiol aromatic ring-opening family dioxygenase [Nitrososphaerales archaeon]